MANSYRSILKKITNTEKRLRPSKQELTAIMDYEMEESVCSTYQDEDVIEDYKTLKDNINGISMDSFSLAYSPVKIKHRRWTQQEL